MMFLGCFSSNHWFPVVSLRFRSIVTSSWIPGFLLFQFSPEELQDWSLTKLGRMAGPKMEKLDTKIWVNNPKLLGSLLRGWLSWVSFHSCVPFYPWFPAVLLMQLRSRYHDFVVENWKNFRLLHFCGWLWKFASRNFGTLQGHKHRQDAGTCSFGVHRWLSKASIVSKKCGRRQSWQSFFWNLFEIWISISFYIFKTNDKSSLLSVLDFETLSCALFGCADFSATIQHSGAAHRPCCRSKVGDKVGDFVLSQRIKAIVLQNQRTSKKRSKDIQIYICEGNQTKHDLNSKVGVWSRSKKRMFLQHINLDQFSHLP